jgi:hypothetical protein
VRSINIHAGMSRASKITIAKSFLFMSSLYFLVCLVKALDPSRPHERGGRFRCV